ncbi:histidine phosphatase superfamily [Boletus coccyginus]|nr:histidine phosphatase superfamily [Boletus coccyginus]
MGPSPKALFPRVAFLTFPFLPAATYFQYPRWHWCSGPPPEIPPEIVTADVSDYPRKYNRLGLPTLCTSRLQSTQRHLSSCEVVQVNLKYQFLRSFKWDLGADELLLLGVRGAFDSGSEHYLRYKDLNGENQLPFVRASDSERVVYSAANWTQGSSAASGHIYSPRVSVIVRRANNTLGDFMCPNTNGHTKPAKAWRDGFTPPIVERMNEVVPGVGLNDRDVAGLMPLCAFEALFHETPSPFCGLFTAEEWQAHKYHNDLLKFYNTRYGNPPGPVQGVGYVDGLLVRLAGQPVRDKTQTDRTLNASPVTFPLDCNLYAGFSRVDWIFAIYSAIAFFHPAEPPITDGLDLSRKWRISRRLPFSRRMIAEELRYSGGGTI